MEADLKNNKIIKIAEGFDGGDGIAKKDNAIFVSSWKKGIVYKIKNGDVLAITNSKTHSQTSAPGFHMYYLWAIRHDDKKRYDGFTYTKQFEGMLE